MFASCFFVNCDFALSFVLYTNRTNVSGCCNSYEGDLPVAWFIHIGIGLFLPSLMTLSWSYSAQASRRKFETPLRAALFVYQTRFSFEVKRAFKTDFTNVYTFGNWNCAPKSKQPSVGSQFLQLHCMYAVFQTCNCLADILTTISDFTLKFIGLICSHLRMFPQNDRSPQSNVHAKWSK